METPTNTPRDTPPDTALVSDSRKAFLFTNDADQLNAVTLDIHGLNLPRSKGPWTFAQEFDIGVQEALPIGIDPEPVLRGLAARGFFVWQTGHTEPFGTGQ